MEDVFLSVKLNSVRSISEKAVIIETIEGDTAVIPKSQIMGFAKHPKGCECLWITEWILKKKNIRYSYNDKGYFLGKEKIIFEEKEIHFPRMMVPVEDNIINELQR